MVNSINIYEHELDKVIGGALVTIDCDTSCKLTNDPELNRKIEEWAAKRCRIGLFAGIVIGILILSPLAILGMMVIHEKAYAKGTEDTLNGLQQNGVIKNWKRTERVGFVHKDANEIKLPSVSQLNNLNYDPSTNLGRPYTVPSGTYVINYKDSVSLGTAESFVGKNIVTLTL